MSMDDAIRVGVFSPNDNRAWVRSENLDLMLRLEGLLIESLQREGIEVIRGGDGFPREDQIAWNRSLVIQQARRIAEARPHALILNQWSWTFPRDSLVAVDIYESTLRALLSEAGDAAARILLFGYKDPRVPGLVAVMPQQFGVPIHASVHSGDAQKAAWLDRLRPNRHEPEKAHYWLGPHSLMVFRWDAASG